MYTSLQMWLWNSVKCVHICFRVHLVLVVHLDSPDLLVAKVNLGPLVHPDPLVIPAPKVHLVHQAKMALLETPVLLALLVLLVHLVLQERKADKEKLVHLDHPDNLDQE